MKINKDTNLSRRKFVKNSALTIGAFSIVPSFVLGKNHVAPSDKITFGFIGAGKQSKTLGKGFLKCQQAQMIACSDVFEGKREEFKNFVNNFYAESKDKEKYDGCQPYADFRELIGRKDIDAIIVATPDHWHHIPSVMALNAGKDVYCEKPLSLTVQEGREMVEATRKNNRVFQTGSMQRSWDKFRRACELVRNGYIGEIKKVQVHVGDPAIPFDLEEETLPAGLDWDTWIGPSEYVPYNSLLAPAPPLQKTPWPKWRKYQEFGGGILCDWGAHMFDIAQWALGMDHTGPVQFNPPTEDAKRGLSMTYANGIEMTHENFGHGWACKFIGSEGDLIISRKEFITTPENIKDKPLSDNDIVLYKSDNHYQDFLDAIKSRKKPICDVEIGHRSASVCNLANIAYDLKRPLTWNPEKEKFKGDGEANKMLKRKNRKPWRI